jgi:hypothetical protein
MIDIQIFKMERTGHHCANRNCKNNPEHMVNILGSVWYIKVDTTVATISVGGRTEYYCRGCIDEVYQLMKQKLDSKLWAFH